MRPNFIFTILLLICPVFITSDYYIYLLTLILIYSIGAMGLNILTGLTGQISLGHAGFFAVGAYSVQIFNNFFHTSFIISFILTIVISVLIGLVIAIPSLRLSGLYLAIVTLVFGLMIERLIYLWTPVTGGGNGLVTTPPSIFFIDINSDIKLYYLVLFFLVLATWIYFSVYESIVGKRFIALKDSEIASNSIGVNVRNYKVLAFVLASIFGAISGSLYGLQIGYITVDHFGFFVSVTFIAMVIIGGLGSKYGPFLGAAFITILPELLGGLEDFQMFAYGLVIVLVFMFWSKGLSGIIDFLVNVLKGKRSKLS